MESKSQWVRLTVKKRKGGTRFQKRRKWRWLQRFEFAQVITMGTEYEGEDSNIRMQSHTLCTFSLILLSLSHLWWLCNNNSQRGKQNGCPCLKEAGDGLSDKSIPNRKTLGTPVCSNCSRLFSKWTLIGFKPGQIILKVIQSYPTPFMCTCVSVCIHMRTCVCLREGKRERERANMTEMVCPNLLTLLVYFQCSHNAFLQMNSLLCTPPAETHLFTLTP